MTYALSILERVGRCCGEVVQSSDFAARIVSGGQGSISGKALTISFRIFPNRMMHKSAAVSLGVKMTFHKLVTFIIYQNL